MRAQVPYCDRMTFFAVQYSYVDDAEALNALRPTHREYLSSLPQLVAGGAYADSPGALLVMRGESEDEILAVLDGDPFWTGKLITQRSIKPWRPVLGVFADQV